VPSLMVLGYRNRIDSYVQCHGKFSLEVSDYPVGGDKHRSSSVVAHGSVVFVPVVVSATGGLEHLAQQHSYGFGVERFGRIVRPDDVAGASDRDPAPAATYGDGDLGPSTDVSQSGRVATRDECNAWSRCQRMVRDAAVNYA